jgi:predicted amidohydrolase/GNAT superfamily N-acetyltransferase
MKVEVKQLKVEYYDDLKASMIRAYEKWGAYWSKQSIEKLVDIFPEGQICVLADGKIVGAALSIIVSYDRFGDNHRFLEITGNYTFSTHDPRGDVLYGIEIFIEPKYRGMRLGRRLYNARKELCEKLNLKGIVAGGRIPEYAKHASQYSPKEYLEQVKLRKIFDPTLTFQISNDFHVKKIIKGYLPGDKESHEFAALIEWINIYYEAKKRLINAKKSNVRLALIQWQMRPFKDLNALLEQIEFFVDGASAYESDFILFPEYIHAPLMAGFNDLSEADAIRKLASFTDAIRERFCEFAIHYNANIICGSMPVIRDDKLLNVGWLCRRNGTSEQYEKLHVTPSERIEWGMTGGNLLKTYDTDCGKIGILICYDVEFPELSRVLADQGMNILFVPFVTDTQNGYTRLKRCAQARAIENECYVAIAGCVGNLPKVHNMDIQYAQSSVFTPSDFAFPTNGVKSEATPNTEMTLITDVDLDLLKDLRYFGSVRTLADRRLDLYSVTFKESQLEEKFALKLDESALKKKMEPEPGSPILS